MQNQLAYDGKSHTKSALIVYWLCQDKNCDRLDIESLPQIKKLQIKGKLVI